MSFPQVEYKKKADLFLQDSFFFFSFLVANAPNVDFTVFNWVSQIFVKNIFFSIQPTVASPLQDFIIQPRFAQAQMRLRYIRNVATPNTISESFIVPDSAPPNPNSAYLNLQLGQLVQANDSLILALGTNGAPFLLGGYVQYNEGIDE